MAKIGVLASPAILLSHIFFDDYHRLLESLSSQNDVFLLGNIGACMPLYAKDSIRLNQLISFRGYSSKVRNYYRVIQSSSRSSFFQRLRRNYGAIIDELIARKAIKYFRTNRVDLIYALPTYPELYLGKILENLGKPLVLEFWEDQIAFLHHLLAWKGLSAREINREIAEGYRWLKSTCRLASHIIVPTLIFKKRLIKLGLHEDKISIIPVCSDTYAPPIDEEVRKIREKHGLGNTQILFYVGSLSLYHDIGTVFSALNRLVASNVSFIIAGGWRDPRKLLRKYRVLPNIKVVYAGRLNPRKELRNYIASADICLGIYRFQYPTGFFPASVIRFMLAGKPIIATNLPEIREMFEDEEAGILVPQADPVALAKAIDLLLSDKDLRLRLGNTARALSQSNYVWPEHSRRFQQIIIKL